MSRRLKILLGAALIVVVAVFLFPAIPQNEAYHNFADKRALLSIPNFLNVASNAFFLLVGASGIAFVFRSPSKDKVYLIDSRERWPYFAFLPWRCDNGVRLVLVSPESQRHDYCLGPHSHGD